MKEIDFIHYPRVVFKNTNSKLADALVADTRASATRALREFCNLMNILLYHFKLLSWSDPIQTDNAVLYSICVTGCAFKYSRRFRPFT